MAAETILWLREKNTRRRRRYMNPAATLGSNQGHHLPRIVGNRPSAPACAYRIVPRGGGGAEVYVDAGGCRVIEAAFC